MKQKRFDPTGFTLVELIIVIAIIAILAAAIFVSIDPARRLHEARNARRRTDVMTMVEAIKQYQVDNDGIHYITIANADFDDPRIIGLPALVCDTTCSAVTVTNTQCLDLSDIGPNYLSRIPKDPTIGTDQWTAYYLIKGSSGNITVGACEPEGEDAGGAGTPPVIEATR
ncbi:prepilin-type N-terminal cleavage/methylation domain-containing protein [Candidatus Peregrinibacteria bacterium]|nr:prepilin-type N-terminal cleavage/methylation domain-containing protein [Candidatus Peregrinibacteria bacterium]